MDNNNECFCNKCGAKNLNTHKFCLMCGNRLTLPIPYKPVESTPSITTQPPEYVFCPQCGANNLDTNRFCLICGNRLNLPVQPTPTQVYYSQPPPASSSVINKPPTPITAPHKKSNKKVIALLIATIVICAIIIGAVVAYTNTHAPPGNGGDGRTYNDVVKNFTWSYNGSTQSILNFSITGEKYSFYKNQTIDRSPTTDEVIASYVTSQDSVIIRIATYLNKIASDYNFSTVDKINNVLAFVQAIRYEEDSSSTGQSDYWRVPVETLYDGCGDCEDTSVLFASIAEAMGYDAVLLIHSNNPGHAGAGVDCTGATGPWFIKYNGIKYYYCETTSTNFKVGEVPSAFKDGPPFPNDGWYVVQVS